VGKANVLYLSTKDLRMPMIDRILHERPHDVVFLNSLFSPVTRRVLALRKISRKSFAPVVMAPRGECAPSALSQKALRKSAFLAAAGAAGLYDDLVWLASSAHEAEHIRAMQKRLKLKGDIYEIPELPVSHSPDREITRPPKIAGQLNAAFLGRISPVKNLVGTLAALATVTGNVTLTIFGPKSDLAYWSECERRIAELPANVVVNAVGPIPHEQVAGILGRQDVLISPSFGENFGHSIIEALSVGCPVITSDQTPWRGLIVNEVGWDLPVDDTGGMSAAIQSLVNMDERAHSAMRKKAVEFAREVTDFGGVAKLNVDLFGSLSRRPVSRRLRIAS
jgi:glycosyltransferase involved in cell wall biosynthesis